MIPNSTQLVRLLTPSDLAWILNKSDRSIERMCGGKKKRPQISVTKVGGENRFTMEAVLEYIVQNTTKADYPAFGPVTARLAAEDLEELWARINRLIETAIANRLGNEERKAA